MWKGTKLVALTNKSLPRWMTDMPSKPIKPRSDFETSKNNLTRKTRFFIYHFIFVPYAKQSAWVYSAIKSKIISMKKQGHYRHFNACLCPCNRATRQDSKLSDFSSQCEKKNTNSTNLYFAPYKFSELLFSHKIL